MEKNASFKEMAQSAPIANIAGLSQPEMVLIAVLAEEVSTPGATIAAAYIRKNTEKAGLTGLGFTLALQRLLGKKYIAQTLEADPNEEYEYDVLQITDVGWAWIDENDGKFILRKNDTITEDDIQF